MEIACVTFPANKHKDHKFLQKKSGMLNGRSSSIDSQQERSRQKNPRERDRHSKIEEGIFSSICKHLCSRLMHVGFRFLLCRERWCKIEEGIKFGCISDGYIYIYARTRRVKTQRKTEEYFSHTNAAEPNSGQVVRP